MGNEQSSAALSARTTRPRMLRVRPVLEIGCGAIVAGIFLVSSLWHTSNPYYFLSSVYRYDLVGPYVGQAIAGIMPFLQLVISFCLLGRVFVRGAFLSAVGLTGLFAIVQLTVVWRDLGISCGCFGAASEESIGLGSLSLVGSLLGMAVVGFACAVAAHDPPDESADEAPAISGETRQAVGAR